MKKSLKSIAAAALSLSLLLGMNTYTFADSGQDEKYEDLFPDAAANLSGLYFTSNLGYKFKLDGGLGEMMVYVDTSNGHSFELIPEDPGFHINDKDGNTVLYAVCMNDEAFEQYSQTCTETKVINGREFLYRANEDGSEDCFSDMRDCGLNCGMAMEIHDGNQESFGLVAFRGTPFEDAETAAASEDLDSDESAGLESDNAANPDSVVPLDETSVPSYSDEELTELLGSLDTDFSKVNWGVNYTMGDACPGIAISVAPYTFFDEKGLIIGITNLYKEDITFSGTAQAKDASDQIIGETYIYESCIGSSNTAVTYITCGDGIPDGRIHWEDCSVEEAYSSYIPWEADYQLTGNPATDMVTVNYDIFAANEPVDFSPNLLTFLLLDENGDVLAEATDFLDTVAAGEKAESSADFYNLGEILSHAKDIAIFCNPY